MTIQKTSDGQAVVDTDHEWIPIKEQTPPFGAKVLLIDRKYGVAILGGWRPGDGFTHWSPLPKFKDKR